jgi:hypothetical protein
MEFQGCPAQCQEEGLLVFSPQKFGGKMGEKW